MEKEKIRQFLVDNFPLAKAKDVGDADQLLDEGIVDSLGVLELVTFIQDELGVAVDDEELVPENFGSVDAIASFVESKTTRSESAS